jgi:hypothetical protein
MKKILIAMAFILVLSKQALAASESYVCSGVIKIVSTSGESMESFELGLSKGDGDKTFEAEIPNSPGSSRFTGKVDPKTGFVNIVNVDVPEKIAFSGTVIFVNNSHSADLGIEMNGKSNGASVRGYLLCGAK